MDWYENVICSHLKKYDFWIARYPANDDGWLQERLRPDFGVGWQYSSKAKIPGISGTVDRNIFYKDYSEETEKKEETTVNKLQEHTKLGDYYANNGGTKPYLEKKSNAYLDDFTKNAGDKNYTKFARDVNNWNQPGCQGQPWCAVYQFWKLVKVFGLTKALHGRRLLQLPECHPSCQTERNLAQHTKERCADHLPEWLTHWIRKLV